MVFVENGYGAATIDLVVNRAGASKATIYSFFGGKEGLFAAIIEERAERILAALPHVGIDQVDVGTTLTEIGRRYMEAGTRAVKLGARVRVKQVWSHASPIAEVILSHAGDNGMDLIVIGAYSHARLAELLFGGATRTLLARMPVPILISR
jgi:nucleotide-binding universal stress UspA family protein